MDNKTPGHGHSHKPRPNAKHYLHSCLKGLNQKRFLKEKEGDRGFTFVELLVVIGIIGILSSVVLTSVSTARGKAIEAKTKQELSQAKAQADIYEIFHSNFGSANNTGANASCTAVNTLFADSGFASVITQAEITSGGSAVCASTPSKWVLAVPLASTPGSFWCTDSTGVSIVGEANTASNAVNCTATGGGGDNNNSDNYNNNNSDNYNGADDDGDGLTNGDEINVYQTDPDLIDSDSDTLTDYNEVFVNNTNPNLNDTDGDGSTDGAEITAGTNPLDPASTPADPPLSGDPDGDGYQSNNDNCPTIANPDQADDNSDGVGDACTDSDSDSVSDALDNCPYLPNEPQTDSNGNGIGDGCESAWDYDTDGFLDSFNPDQPESPIDQCVYDYNPLPVSEGGNGCP